MFGLKDSVLAGVHVSSST